MALSCTIFELFDVE